MMPAAPSHPARLFLTGVKDAAPICLAAIPIGLSYGVLALETGLSVWQTILMSLIVFAGASQLMAVGMIAVGVGPVEIILSTFLMNLRHIVMSSYVMNKLRSTRTSAKLGLAFGITDETFALFSLAEAGKQRPWYMAGLGLTMYFCWAVSTTVGALAANVLPEVVSKSLGIAFYAAFLAMLLPNIKGHRPLLLVVAITAVINGVLNLFLSPGISVICSILLGSLIGTFLPDEKQPAEAGKEAVQ